jgi:hypothetical protein
MTSRRHFIAIACALLLRGCRSRAGPRSVPAKFDPIARRGARCRGRPAVARAHEEARAGRGRRRVVLVVPHHGSLLRRESELKALRDERFVWLKVNYSKQNENEALLSRWPKVAGYPHLFVLEPTAACCIRRTRARWKPARPTTLRPFRKFLLDWSESRDQNCALIPIVPAHFAVSWTPFT